MRDELSEAAYRLSLSDSFAQCFAEWSRIPPEVWAEEVYRLPTGGRFRWSYAPYARRMFHSLFERQNIETVFQLFSRGLKSTVILLAIGYVIDQAPRRILSLWPTNSQAEKFSKDILVGELFDTTEPLRFLGSACKKRTGSVTMLHKVFPGGLIDMFGANAPGDMRRAKGSFLYGDEIDAIDTTETDEGDQLQIFGKRGDEYPDTIRVFASYPSLRDHSRIEAKLRETDYNEWHVMCAKCGDPFVMHRRQLRYEPEKTSETRFQCPLCNELLTDAQRVQMARAGEWKARNPYRGRRGFHANSMLWPHPVDDTKYPGGFLQLLAEKEVAAEKSDDPKRARRVIVNTEDAETYAPENANELPPEWSELWKAREDYATSSGIVVPERGLVLNAGVDAQPDRLEVHKGAYGRCEEYYAIEHVIIPGDIHSPHTWDALEEELLRPYDHALGGKINLSFALIDAGHGAEHLLWFLSQLRKKASPLSGIVRACRGSSQYPHPVVDSRFSRLVKQLKGHWVGTDEAKDALYARLRAGKECDAQRHHGMNHDERWFQQLTVERLSVEIRAGKEERRYRNENKSRNEALDCSVYEYAAFKLKKWNFDAIEAQLKAETATAEPEKPKPAAKPHSWGSVSGRGWSI
jgi:phage terminase large subunit GpA-like protein